MTDQMARDLAEAINERIAARKAASARRKENLRQLHALRKAARDAGLARRHAAKLARAQRGEAEASDRTPDENARASRDDREREAE